MVVTDWRAMNDRIAASRAVKKETAATVCNGSLPESCVDDSARRVLKLVFQSAETSKKASCEYDAHHVLANRRRRPEQYC